MSNMNQSESKQSQVASKEALAPMRTLSSEELVEDVGGPEIQNGGSLVVAVSATSIGG
jgi:hypothetical protein